MPGLGMAVMVTVSPSVARTWFEETVPGPSVGKYMWNEVSKYHSSSS